MGMSCLIQAREETRPGGFIPPAWAYHFTKEDLPYRIPDMDDPNENFWYMELGGEDDAIADTERVREELLKAAYGVLPRPACLPNSGSSRWRPGAPENAACSRLKLNERFFRPHGPPVKKSKTVLT